jgi:hypothetical protein
MSFKIEIERLRFEKLQRRFPQHDADWINRMWHGVAIKYTKGRSAPGCEKNIVDFLQLLGHQAEKISVTGRSIDNSKKITDVIGRERMIGSRTWIPSTSARGSADISATIFGLSVKIEVKIGKDRQSKHQIEYESTINDAGGIYLIARSEEDLLDKYNQLLELPQMQLMRNFRK